MSQQKNTGTQSWKAHMKATVKKTENKVGSGMSCLTPHPVWPFPLKQGSHQSNPEDPWNVQFSISLYNLDP